MSTAPLPDPDFNLILPLPVGPEPPPTDTGRQVQESLWQRFRAWLAGVRRPRLRGMTDLEVSQATEIDRLRLAVWDRDNQIFRLKNELVDVRAEVKAQAKQIAYWVAVHERDRAHIEKDRAILAHVTAMAAPRDGTGRPELHPGD